MKKIILMVVAAMMAISASAQETVKKIRLYEGISIIFEREYNSVDSVVFVNEIVPQPQQPDTTPANPNFHPKAFTVNSVGKPVYFSQGNLQYQASTDTWRFAENQYDMIGEDNSNISSTYDGWIDLFGWGTSGWDNTANDPFAVNYQPWTTSTNEISGSYTIPSTEISSINCEMQAITGKCDTTWADGGTYSAYDFNVYGYGPSIFNTNRNLTGANANYDWGVYNAISNGGGEAGLWRTLTYAEWNYIFNDRPLAQYLRSQATVCGVHGYVLLPDDFTLPDGLSWNYQTNDWDTNTYGPQAWSAMEATGAVFLPAVGFRFGTDVSSVGSYGNYWSASTDSVSFDARYDANDVEFGYRPTSDGLHSRRYGHSVRLVQDIKYFDIVYRYSVKPNPRNLDFCLFVKE